MYYIRKYLYIAVILIFAIIITVLGVQGVNQSTIFALSLVAVLVCWICVYIRPSAKEFAKNGKRWVKKYEYINTTEETKSHKDGSFEVYYTHNFKVYCKEPTSELTYEYELHKNGGVSGKDKYGKTYSKRISKNLFLKNLDVLDSND